MPSDPENLDHARRYLEAIEAGATGDELGRFFAPDVVQEEFPNRLLPQGARRDLLAILDAAARGRAAMSSQSYRILHAVGEGNELALEVEWVGTLAVPFGQLPAGGTMRPESSEQSEGTGLNELSLCQSMLASW